MELGHLLLKITMNLISANVKPHYLIINKLFLKFIQLRNYSKLTPKIPWDQKLVNFFLGSLCKEKFKKIQFVFLDKWTTYFTNFPGTPSTPNLNSIWDPGEVLLKAGIKIIFPIFSEELLHATMWLMLPKDWRTRY